MHKSYFWLIFLNYCPGRSALQTLGDSSMPWRRHWSPFFSSKSLCFTDSKEFRNSGWLSSNRSFLSVLIIILCMWQINSVQHGHLCPTSCRPTLLSLLRSMFSSFLRHVTLLVLFIMADVTITGLCHHQYYLSLGSKQPPGNWPSFTDEPRSFER